MLELEVAVMEAVMEVAVEVLVEVLVAVVAVVVVVVVVVGVPSHRPPFSSLNTIRLPSPDIETACTWVPVSCCIQLVPVSVLRKRKLLPTIASLVPSDDMLTFRHDQ